MYCGHYIWQIGLAQQCSVARLCNGSGWAQYWNSVRLASYYHSRVQLGIWPVTDNPQKEALHNLHSFTPISYVGLHCNMIHSNIQSKTILYMSQNPVLLM